MTTTILYPTSDNTAGWSTYPASPTTHYTKVDEVTANTTDYNYVKNQTAAHYDKYGMTDISLGTDTVSNLRISAYSRGIANFDGIYPDVWMYLNNGVSDSALILLVSTDLWGYDVSDYALSPFTGLAWTEAEINSLIFCLKGVNNQSSLPDWGGWSVSQCKLIVTHAAPPAAGQPYISRVQRIEGMRTW